ncbi:MAG: 3-deoxy-manno-octulosonate cytidylyltransferase [bacterium]
MMEYIGIIPARYGSSRFPGKPLCDINGKPMIWHVHNSVSKWDKWKDIYVATDDVRIWNECKKYDIKCIMTQDCHTDCLDRAAEIVEILEAENKGADRYIIIQGDEPLFEADTLNCDLSADIINFYTEVQKSIEKYDGNAVKVAVSETEKAIYFSRYSIPYHNPETMRSKDDVIIYKQIGVYVFSGEKLKLYASMRPTYLENIEGIGLLRFLENDIPIQMRYTKYDSVSVDTEEDRQRIVEMINNNE